MTEIELDGAIKIHNQKKIYVLYHHPCMDGMGAKYAAWKKFGDKAEYIGVNYNQPVPQLEPGSVVYIIDFSYPKDILRGMQKVMSELVVLDHHKTAQEDLAGEPYAIFDMNRSGAVMAWDYFFPGVEAPKLLQIIQDRDLWKFKFPETRHVFNYMNLHGDDVTTWDEVIKLPGYVVGKGSLITKYQEQLTRNSSKTDMVKVIQWSVVPNVKAGLLNSTNFPSEIGESIVKNPELGVDFSITYFIDKEGVVNLSFRSIGDFDVGAIAKSFGGGGHKDASGARISMEKLASWLN